MREAVKCHRCGKTYRQSTSQSQYCPGCMSAILNRTKLRSHLSGRVPRRGLKRR